MGVIAYWRLMNIFVLLILTQFMTIAQSLSSPKWEFMGSRQPYYETLEHFDGQYFDLTCEDRSDVMYENYAQLHPQFRPLMKNYELRTRWRRSLVLRGSRGVGPLNHCFYRILTKHWRNYEFSQSRKTLVHCGRMVEILKPDEHYAAKAVDEMLEYAMNGGAFPTIWFLSDATSRDLINLNADLRYYLQLNLKKYIALDARLESKLAQRHEKLLMNDAGLELMLRRRKFVEEAFTRSDYKSVLITTAPCQVA